MKIYNFLAAAAALSTVMALPGKSQLERFCAKPKHMHNARCEIWSTLKHNHKANLNEFTGDEYGYTDKAIKRAVGYICTHLRQDPKMAPEQVEKEWPLCKTHKGEQGDSISRMLAYFLTPKNERPDTSVVWALPESSN